MTTDQHATAQAARQALARLGSWALLRARERSTWIGLAGAFGALGWSTGKEHLTQAADFIPMILGAGGVAIAAASTSPRSPAADGQAGSDGPAA